MKTSDKQIIINHKARDLYNIVLDIEKYPDYIPWCKDIIIKSIKDNEIVADMVVNYKFFPEQIFSSHVTFDKKKLIINTNYIDGPLKNLITSWNFEKLAFNETKITFSLKFEFQKYLHQKLAELFFPLIENSMVDSFIKRANETLD